MMKLLGVVNMVAVPGMYCVLSGSDNPKIRKHMMMVAVIYMAMQVVHNIAFQQGKVDPEFSKGLAARGL